MVHLSSSGVRIGSWDLPQSLDNPCISEPVGVCLVQNQWSSGLAATEEENPGVLEFSQKRFGFQGGGRCGCPHRPPALAFALGLVLLPLPPQNVRKCLLLGPCLPA